MNQGLSDAKKNEKRWGRYAGIGEPPRPWIGIGTASEREREKRHAKRHGQDQSRGDNCERRRHCGLRADDDMKGAE
jgi:hypothetical protein